MAVNEYARTLPGPLGARPYGADWNAGLTTQPFVLYTEAGAVAATLWINASKLYGKFSAVAPTSATDGTVIGTQT